MISDCSLRLAISGHLLAPYLVRKVSLQYLGRLGFFIPPALKRTISKHLLNFILCHIQCPIGGSRADVMFNADTAYVAERSHQILGFFLVVLEEALVVFHVFLVASDVSVFVLVSSC